MFFWKSCCSLMSSSTHGGSWTCGGPGPGPGPSWSMRCRLLCVKQAGTLMTTGENHNFMTGRNKRAWDDQSSSELSEWDVSPAVGLLTLECLSVPAGSSKHHRGQITPLSLNFPSAALKSFSSNSCLTEDVMFFMVVTESVVSYLSCLCLGETSETSASSLRPKTLQGDDNVINVRSNLNV